MPEWTYLTSEAFQTRYVLAAHFVKDCANIIEVGGYKTPITTFLTGKHDSVLVLDPLTEPYEAHMLYGRIGSVSHIPIGFGEAVINIENLGNYGLVMLGMAIRDDHAKLFDLVKRAAVVVIEFPPDFEPSAKLFHAIISTTGRKIALQLGLDMTGNDFGDLSNSWHPRCQRMMYVLR